MATELKGIIQEQVTVNHMDHSVITEDAPVIVSIPVYEGNALVTVNKSKGHVLKVYGNHFTVTCGLQKWNAFTGDSIAEGRVTFL